MDSILDYFISLQESEPADLPERAIERFLQTDRLHGQLKPIAFVLRLRK